MDFKKQYKLLYNAIRNIGILLGVILLVIAVLFGLKGQ